MSDSRDTSESSSRPGDAIATRPRRIRARSAVSGARACPAKCVPSPPRVVSSHPRKRVQKKARKEVSHRVSRGFPGSQTRKSNWTRHANLPNPTREKKNLADPSPQGRPDFFTRGRSRPFNAQLSRSAVQKPSVVEPKNLINGRFSIGRTFFDTRSRRPAAKIGPDALFRTRAARTCRRLCTAPDTSRSAKTRFVQRTAKGSDGGGVPPRSRRRQGGIG